MPNGKVYIVGAGPGHPELLTVKAARLLEAADVVVYDRLVQEEVLALARPSAERIYMGKPVGLHESRQDELNRLLVREAREGKTVIRLKGGDPYLFGRGGEEAEYLADHDIPFEVVPGVSSALAAPLSAGIALTHRDAASTVAIVTGHEATREHSRINWDALAGIDTLVFLMAVHSVERIARELISRGRDPRTPAAMIQMAFWHGEKVAAAPLDSIAGEAERAGINPPATLVIGEVVGLREKLVRAQRDLRRSADGNRAFEPAPAPDELLRMAAGGIGSQVLLFALVAGLFEQLGEWCTARDLARGLALNRAGLAEVLECLVSMGLVEGGPQGYRNLELATRYLLDSSPHSLRPAILGLAGHLAPTSIGRYVLDGRENGAPPEVYKLHKQACDCLARFAAPFVLDKVEWGACGRVLVVGWGGEAYRGLASSRWPAAALEVRNPFEPDSPADPAGAIVPGENGFAAVLLSGLLGCCEREQYRPAMERAAGVLNADGTLYLHDFFFCSGTPSPPEVVLSTFGRHVLRGGSRAWSLDRVRDELGSLGLRVLRADQMPGGPHLVAASRT
jgi:uroporphyrin-III C-methyltransferase